MPSQREQTIISTKGLMTIPEPYRAYFGLVEGDKIIVKWDKFVVVIPRKILDEVSDFEQGLIDALLSKKGPDTVFHLLWHRIPDQRKEQILNILGLRRVEVANI